MTLLSINPIKTLITRSIGQARGKKPFHYPGGIKYPGFTYYPRTPEFKDPPYQPSKLLMLKRIKPLNCIPYWEKQILQRMNLTGKMSEVSIVKNIPEINSYLWRVKHLIQIKPVTFPNGFPKDAKGTYLKENGELTVTKHIYVDEDIKRIEDLANNPKRMDSNTLRRDLRKRWDSGW